MLAWKTAKIAGDAVAAIRLPVKSDVWQILDSKVSWLGRPNPRPPLAALDFPRPLESRQLPVHVSSFPLPD